MKTGKLVKVAVVFAILINTMSLFSQKVITDEGKCPSLSVTPLNQNVPSSSGTTGFTVISNVCWTASSNQVWCTVTASGSNNGTITAAYEENTGTETRIAVITVSGEGTGDIVVTVTQTGTSPVLIVTPLNRDVSSSSGTTAFAVASNINWTTSCEQSWCTVTPSGTNNGTITATYEENTGSDTRTATIAVYGTGVAARVVTVTQTGTSPSLVVTPMNQNVSSDPGTVRFIVTSDIPWNASSDQAWCTVTPSGTGDGSISAVYQRNTGINTRVATITVSGPGVNNEMVTVTQLGTAPSLLVTPSNRDVTSDPGITGFEVASNISWSSASNREWCTVTPSGTGNGTITAVCQTFSEVGTRIATITVSGTGVGDQVVTVTQSGVPPVLSVTPLIQYVTSPAGTTVFEIASNISWSSSSDQSWCTVTPSGTGNGNINAAYEANDTASPRTATITIAGPGIESQTVTLIQDEFITISYSGSPWCPSAGLRYVLLSGTPGGTYSVQPDGLDIDPETGTITTANSIAGSYTVKYVLEKPEGNRNIEASDEVGIIPVVQPQITIKWEDVLICSNVEDLYTGYQWYKGNSPIAGANGQYYVTNKTPGSYSVEATDRNGCKIMSDVITIGSTKSLLAYPNPVRNSLKIRLNDDPTGKVIIRIINPSGREVMNLNTEKTGYEFSEEILTGELDEGLYLLQVTVNETSSYYVKIMVIN